MNPRNYIRQNRQLFLSFGVCILFALTLVMPAYAADKPSEMSPQAKPVTHDPNVFNPDPNYEEKKYDAAPAGLACKKTSHRPGGGLGCHVAVTCFLFTRKTSHRNDLFFGHAKKQVTAVTCFWTCEKQVTAATCFLDVRKT